MAGGEAQLAFAVVRPPGHHAGHHIRVHVDVHHGRLALGLLHGLAQGRAKGTAARTAATPDEGTPADKQFAFRAPASTFSSRQIWKSDAM